MRPTPATTNIRPTRKPDEYRGRRMNPTSGPLLRSRDGHGDEPYSNPHQCTYTGLTDEQPDANADKQERRDENPTHFSLCGFRAFLVRSVFDKRIYQGFVNYKTDRRSGSAP